jgi:hypothetical protein
MENAMNIIKPVTTLYLVFFACLFAWAIWADPTLVGFFRAIEEPWTVVVLMDFVFGCLLFTWVIFFVEGSAKSTVPWAVALFIIGNIVGAVYVLLRFEKIKQRLSAAA